MRDLLSAPLSPPDPSPTRFSGLVIEDPRALAALEPEWWDLWRRTPSATPFQSPAWLLPWRRIFAPEPLAVGAIRCGRRLVALAPFYREQIVDGTRLMPLGVSISDYLDVLLDPAVPGATAAVTNLIASMRWDCCSFEELPPQSQAATMPPPDDCSDLVEPHSACPVLALRGGPDLVGCVPARRRRQSRRAWATAARLGDVRIERAEANSERFLATLFALHRARWDERGEIGVLADEKVRRFHQEALPRLAAAGLAHCSILKVGGKEVAAYYGFVHRARAYAYLGGFDPRFEEISPGAILIGLAIADAIEEGAQEYHFLRGREAYKYSWGATDRWNQRRLWTRLGHA